MKEVTISEVLKDVKDRSNSITPPFFERIQKWAKVAAWAAGGIGTTGLIVTSSLATYGVAVPLWVIISMSILTGLGTGGGVGAAKVAKMTTTNKEILSRPSNTKL